MTAKKLLDGLGRFGRTETVFSFPYIKVFVVSDKFAGLDDEDRESRIAGDLRVTMGELRSTIQNSLFVLECVTAQELEQNSGWNRARGQHWLSALVAPRPRPANAGLSTPVIHFYGYKGGQARSTVLATLSCALARDGWRILVVDGDIEAPSLDVIYTTTTASLSRSLLGIVQGVSAIGATNARPGKNDTAAIDLICCRPRSSEYDIDMAAFALRSVLEPTILERAADRIGQFAASEGYDAILVDHRSGLSPATLPIMSRLPGPVVVCVKLDEQWRGAKAFLKYIFTINPDNPGVFVCFKPDTESEASFLQRTFGQRDELLSMLASAVSEHEVVQAPLFSGDQELSSVELEDHCIIWPYDEAFRSSRLPELDQLSSPVREAISGLRSLVGPIGTKAPTPQALRSIVTSPSGATDEGDLIITEALRKLLANNNPYSYIFGRKGTGKTRLVRELAARAIGEPLLVASDSPDPRGFQSTQPELQAVVERYSERPEWFWWYLVWAGLLGPTTDRISLAGRFRELVNEDAGLGILDRILAAKGPRRVFLFDGLETTFQSKYIFGYLEGLLRVLQTIESDNRLSDLIGFRLFLRQDLAERGFQNIEQQTYGKRLDLSWNYQTILNFTLSRIMVNKWYQDTFPDLAAKLSEMRDLILAGGQTTEICESLLLLAFPEKLRRNNLRTTTFLRTYFADSASERSDRLAYYPRIFARLIEAIPDPAVRTQGVGQIAELENGRISQTLIFLAHADAATKYLTGLKEELRFLIDLSKDSSSDNQQRLETLLAAFDGLTTPFDIEERVKELANKTGIEAIAVRRALERMKTVGMFESRPDYPGEWRVGRLFKSSLRMKYFRR